MSRERSKLADRQQHALRSLLAAQRAIEAALSGVLDDSAAPEVRPRLDELRYAAKWFAGELEKRVPRGRDRRAAAITPLGLSADRLTAVPTLADRVRLVSRGLRWVVALIDTLLAEDLGPDLRALAEEARDVHLRGVRQCEETIEMLDRDREVLRLRHVE